MKLKTKLYKVNIGLCSKMDEDITNWGSRTVIAISAKAASDRVELKKSEYILSVEFLMAIDVP